MNDFRKMFPKAESIFLLAVLGGVFPILCFLAGWWGSIAILPEESIKYAALGGLLAGILIDILLLKRWLVRAYHMNLTWLAVIYLFYSAGLYGFFMGVSVFNFLLGLFAGFYMGLRMLDNGKSKAEAEAAFHKTGIFASLVLAVACGLSMWLAASDSSTAANINGMLALRQPLSRQGILWMAGAGGAVLVVLEYFITRGMARWAYK